MTVVAALAAVAVAASAASAYVSYQGVRNQAKVGEQAAALKAQQVKTELATTALQARQQEEARQAQADLLRSSGIAGAAGAGIDYWLSPTAQTIDAENTRIANADISSIRLLGSAKASRLYLEGRGAELEGSAYSAMGANAWIQPTLSFMQSAASMGITASGGLGGGGVDGRNAALSSQAKDIASRGLT